MTPNEEAIVAQARGILARYLNRNPILSSWNAVVDYCRMTIQASPLERFHVLYLDGANRLIEDVHFATGTANHVPVYPREIARKGLELNALALLLVHNHPSQSTAPSAADIEMTRQVQAALEPLGIILHDHIIIAGDTYTSFRSEGLF